MIKTSKLFLLALLVAGTTAVVAPTNVQADDTTQRQEQELEVECDIESYGQAHCRAKGKQKQEQRIAGASCDEFVTREDGTKVCVHQMADTALPMAGAATAASIILSGAGYAVLKLSQG